MRMLMLAAGAALVLSSGGALAGCPEAAEIDRVLTDWTAKMPTKALSAATFDDAACGQKKLVAKLAQSQGTVVGYKAGLTAKAVQERFGATAPVAGVLYSKMILDDGATVPAAFGARGVWEADMLLVVKDESINDAKTPEQALKALRGWRPFIELPDLTLATSEKLDGVQLLALNVGARFGVAGPEIAFAPTPEIATALAAVKITALVDGAVTTESTGAAVLGSPLNVMVWLVEDLKKNGYRLKAGDLISVGSFSPLSPPKPGQTVSVRYEGLVKPAAVSVKFQ